MLQKEGVKDARKVADAAGKAFEENPHWQTSSHQEQEVRKSLYKAFIDAGEEEVLEAMELGRSAYQGTSLDHPSGDDANGTTVAERLGGPDPEMEASRARASIRGLLDHLPERERSILYLRFFEDLTQSEIADRVGISQMHVSRLIRQSLEQLRQVSRERAAVSLETGEPGA